MRRENSYVSPKEFAAICKIPASLTPAQRETRLRKIVGDFLVDRMKKFHAEEPTVFVFCSWQPAEMEFTLDDEKGEA